MKKLFATLTVVMLAFAMLSMSACSALTDLFGGGKDDVKVSGNTYRYQFDTINYEVTEGANENAIRINEGEGTFEFLAAEVTYDWEKQESTVVTDEDGNIVYYAVFTGRYTLVGDKYTVEVDQEPDSEPMPFTEFTKVGNKLVCTISVIDMMGELIGGDEADEDVVFDMTIELTLNEENENEEYIEYIGTRQLLTAENLLSMEFEFKTGNKATMNMAMFGFDMGGQDLVYSVSGKNVSIGLGEVKSGKVVFEDEDYVLVLTANGSNLELIFDLENEMHQGLIEAFAGLEEYGIEMDATKLVFAKK